MITLEQQEEVVRLYQSHLLTIKQIMMVSGVKSEQTIYRILDDYRIPRREKRQAEMRLCISVDEYTAYIIDKAAPINISKWICEQIKENYKRKKDNDNRRKDSQTD
ncbi:MAG: hypothetical protein KH425_00150 [Prevotella bivia]|jgi:predicted DNA-binding transcriptional regulator AlpA|uniref:hypothetical protein n=1 Tax=uncultured Prevotella sp. TaxID=159272 RepID=UPI00280600D7|nr:hypothetical protein [uncultured Prevotella sp.]MBS6328004.1 hypothetical protein [Prevotella bivia]